MARPWTVVPSDLAKIDDYKLKPILRALIHAEAHRAGCDPRGVIVNAEDRAADDGIDAITPAPASPSSWLGDGATCWQWKHGSAGEPARLNGEVGKPGPSATLRSGGRFVVVASGAKNGDAGRKDRLAVLTKAAKKLRLPTSQIDVVTSETLAAWLDEHPGLAAELNGLPSGCCSMEFWERDPHHQISWHAGAKASVIVAALTRDLNPNATTSTSHVHIVGQPGVGKTRLAFEACRAAPWRGDVIYVADGQRVDVDTLLTRLIAHPRATAVVVVDEAAPSDTRRWNSLVCREPTRLCLLTLGTSDAPPAIPVLIHRLGPLESSEVLALIASWYPAMPEERREFLAKFSEGYVRLAKVSANALEKDRDLDIPALLRDRNVKHVLDALLGNSPLRRSLSVLAALDSVGWEGRREDEGRSIAEHLGLDWRRVRDDVEALHEQHGIAPRAGDLRYVSPRPLGVLVATELWETHPSLMRTLYEKLPTPGARKAYEERLRFIATAPQVQAFATSELGRFGDLTEVRDEAGARRWAALGHAHADTACRLICQALGDASNEGRRQLAPSARRRLVWGLVEFAWHRDAFHDAVLALAHLAVQETETYANNATAEFIGKFQIALGGTSAPYSERFALLDELSQDEDPAYRVLVVRALVKGIDTRGEMRIGGPADGASPPAPEWRPQTMGEHAAIVLGALERLIKMAQSDGSEAVGVALVDACRHASMQLRVAAVRELVAALVRAVAGRSAAACEQLWRDLDDLITREEKYWKALGAADLDWLYGLRRELDGTTIDDRVRREVSVADFSDSADRYMELAAELLARRDTWEATWTWLTTARTSGAWLFGQALAQVDHDAHFLAFVEQAPPGTDLRALTGFITERGKSEGAAWADEWLDRYYRAHEDRASIVAELTWRCTPTERGARRFIEIVRSGTIHAGVSEQLSYGGWAHAVPVDVLAELVKELEARPEHRGAALVLIDGRVEKESGFLHAIESTAVELVTDVGLVRDSPNHGYYWQRLASALLPAHTRAIARAVLAAHDTRTRPSGWFIEHSTYAGVVLSQCIDADSQVVWEELAPYLADDSLMAIYVIGLPPLLDRMPRASVLAWIDEEAAIRAARLAPLIAKRTEPDSLFVEILDRYGDVEDVAGAFGAHLYTGQWSGDSSKHWDGLADGLEPLAARRNRSKATRWAKKMVGDLRARANNERKREAERRVRGF